MKAKKRWLNLTFVLPITFLTTIACAALPSNVIDQPVGDFPALKPTSPAFGSEIKNHPSENKNPNVKPKPNLPSDGDDKSVSPIPPIVSDEPEQPPNPPVTNPTNPQENSETDTPDQPNPEPEPEKTPHPEPRVVPTPSNPTKISDPPTAKQETEAETNQAYQVYNQYTDLIKPNLNFTNKNFKAISLENGKFQKNYRLHQLFDNAIWKFDKSKNNFSWSVDEQWITNMTKRDSGGSNIMLYLYIESITFDNKNDAINKVYLFKDYDTDRSNGKEDTKYRYNKPTQYPLGIKLNWKKLQTQRNLNISTPKWFDVQVAYDPNTKMLNFTLVSKNSIKFTNDPVVVYQSQKTDKVVYIPSVNNFFSLSFKTNNNENKTIERFIIPSKAETGVNVNAFDLATRDPNQLNQNRYLDLGYQIDRNKISQNKIDDLTQELITRSFFNLNYDPNISGHFAITGGTWTMIAKVKPSDNTDQRYYVMTNQHVKASVTNNFETNSIKGVGFRKYIATSDTNYELYDKDNSIAPLSRFWGFRNWKNRFDFNVVNNGKKAMETKLDVQISILDLAKVFQIIDKNLKSETSASSQKNLKALKNDFEKWKTLSPLKFTDRYKLIGLNSTYLDQWSIVGYPSGTLTAAKFNSFNAFATSDIVRNSYTSGYRGWLNNKPIEKNLSLMGKGSSGSLIVNADRKIVGIHNMDDLPGKGGLSYGFFFYSPLYDIIGSNVDGSNPSQNKNPSTFGHAVIAAHKKYPEKFEILREFQELIS